MNNVFALRPRRRCEKQDIDMLDSTDRLLRPLVVAFIVFVVSAVAAATLILRAEHSRLHEERARVSEMAADRAEALQRHIERAMSAAYALAALVRQGNGALPNFDAVALQMLPFYPGAALGLAPGGVVQRIIPMAGNEKAIGHDMLHDPARAKESVLARDTRRLTLAGPFNLVQGGVGAVGRMPVFLDDLKGRSVFWGFTTVLIRFPETLASARLPQLVARGFNYELWRIAPDTGRKQIIASSSHEALVAPVNRVVELSNDSWTLSIAPIKGWADPVGLTFRSALGLLFSLLLAYAARLLVQLRMHERKLEAVVAERTADVEAREAELDRAQSVGGFGSWVLDLATGEINPSWETCRILGLPASTPFKYETLVERVHPSDREAVDQAWKATLEGERYDVEHRIVAGGATGWVHSQAEPLFAPDGAIQAYLGTTHDITERKRTEDSLRLFRALVDHSNDAIEVIDAETGQFLDVNERGCLDLGYSREELLTLSVFDVDPGVDQSTWRMSAKELRKSGTLLWTGLHQRKDGSTFPVEVNLRRVQFDRPYLVAVARDITERVRTEQEMRDSVERFQLVSRATFNAIWDLDLRTNVLWRNDNYLLLFGYPPAEIEPNHEFWSNRLHPEDRDRAERGFQAALESGREFWTEAYRFRRRDGSYADVEDRGYIIRDAQGRAVRILGAMQDMSERKAAEKALVQSELRLRTLIEEAPIAIGISRNGIIVYTNKKYLEMYGYQSVDDLRGQPIVEQWAPHCRPQIEEIRRICNLGPPVPSEFEAVGQRKDGSLFPVHAAVTLVQLPDGLASMAFLTDITERTRAEAALRLRDNALEAAANAIVITDSDGRIEWCNQAFTSLTGFRVAEIIGESPRILKSGVQDRVFYEDLWRTISTGEVWHGEIVNRRKDGTLYPEEMTITPVLDSQTGLRHFIAVKQDITQRKRSEEALEQSRAQLVQAQKMEAIGQLAGGVAHDFNNLLQAMLSLGTVLRLRAESPAMSTIVAEMVALIARGASVTRQLLLFSRRSVMAKAPLELDELARGTSVLLRRLLPENIQLAVETGGGQLWVDGDAGQLQQVLTNLAVNARDAMPEGGTLTVRVVGDQTTAVLEVEDTGVGIDDLTREHLFEPFFTTKAPGAGTGLGLAVVHGIVEQHGGRIEVESTPGRGSRFRIIFRAVPPPGATTASGPNLDAELPDGHGQQVLLVEDDEDVCAGLVAVLEVLNYRVTSVSSGEEASALPSEPAPDLLLTDLMLPGIGGSDLAKHLRERWPALKVVLMSGYTNDEAVRRRVDEGAEWFLQKPFDMSALARTLRDALDEH